MKTHLTSHITSAIAMISLGLAGLTSAQAAILVVAPGDITGGNAYDFTINGGNTSPSPNLGQYGVAGAGVGLVSNTNFLYHNEGGAFVTNFLRVDGPSGSSAELVLGWDFSTSGYRPTSVDLTNITVGFGDTPATWTLSTSTDNVTYTTYATISTFTNPTPTQTVAISGSPDAFYLKVNVTNSGGFPLTQWGRNDANVASEAFSAEFTVAAVPEPSTVALLLMGGLGTQFMLRRRRTA